MKETTQATSGYDATPGQGSPATAAPETAGGGGGSRWVRPVIALVALAALIALGSQAGPYLKSFQEWVQGLGALGPIVFILGYAVATVAFAPGAPLTLAAGPIFGIAWGTLYVFVAATLGASLAFLSARYFVRSWVEQRVSNDARFASIDRAVGREGLKIVTLLRLSPIFPFNLLNYALGLTKVRFTDYVVASVGMIPGTLLYVYIGAVSGRAAIAASDSVEPAAGTGNLTLVFQIVGLLVTIGVTVFVTRVARRALREATGE